MNKLILILFFVFGFVANLYSQTNLNIQYTNGALSSIPLADLDSINYTINIDTCPAFVTDVEGNIYDVVAFGNQCWMKENLKTSHYRNGALIPSPANDAQWNATVTGACADYNYSTANTNIYGKLYNYFAVADTQGLCPVGWHVTEDWEWNVVVKRIDPYADTTCLCYQSLTAGTALKETGYIHWIGPVSSSHSTNSSRLTLFAGGHRLGQGSFNTLRQEAFFWTATKIPGTFPYARYLTYLNNCILRTNGYNGKYGLSVRCVQDY
jgi:uncharacterized protein (TIGR02145 family)